MAGSDLAVLILDNNLVIRIKIFMKILVTKIIKIKKKHTTMLRSTKGQNKKYQYASKYISSAFTS